MSLKFTALICFMHGSNVYNPTGDIYEHENDQLVKAWDNAGYAKIASKGSEVLDISKDDTHENVQIDTQDVLDALKGLTYVELKERAKEAGIKGYHNMKAEKLIEALKEVE